MTKPKFKIDDIIVRRYNAKKYFIYNIWEDHYIAYPYYEHAGVTCDSYINIPFTDEDEWLVVNG